MDPMDICTNSKAKLVCVGSVSIQSQLGFQTGDSFELFAHLRSIELCRTDGPPMTHPKPPRLVESTAEFVELMSLGVSFVMSLPLHPVSPDLYYEQQGSRAVNRRGDRGYRI